MKKLALLALVLAGCQADNKNVERKLDELLREVKALKGAGVGGGGARPQRPEPKPDKTYAINIEGDAFVGPADAKVTIVEAFDYG
jgi:hypothetical protein